MANQVKPIEKGASSRFIPPQRTYGDSTLSNHAQPLYQNGGLKFDAGGSHDSLGGNTDLYCYTSWTSEAGHSRSSIPHYPAPYPAQATQYRPLQTQPPPSPEYVNTHAQPFPHHHPQAAALCPDSAFASMSHTPSHRPPSHSRGEPGIPPSSAGLPAPIFFEVVANEHIPHIDASCCCSSSTLLTEYPVGTPPLFPAGFLPPVETHVSEHISHE